MDLVKQTLLDARALLMDGRNWTKGSFERVREDGGRCYCLLGAIRHVQPNRGAGVGALNLLRKHIGRESISVWNDEDDRTHADVLRVLKVVAKKVA